MARVGVSDIVTWGGVTGISYLGYKMALGGTFGAVGWNVAASIYKALHNGQLPPALPAGGGGGGGGGLTMAEACALARSRLGALDSSWLAATDAQIKAKVCGDPTVFVGTTGEDPSIRQAFGCPIY